MCVQVFRMTLVKQLNMDEVLECVYLISILMRCHELSCSGCLNGCCRYVTLVNRGTPDFIEIKGVTFCGGSRSELSMSNVPWHEEVRGRLCVRSCCAPTPWTGYFVRQPDAGTSRFV